MGPLPVTVLCGFLGAGKTTQLNRLLRHAGRRIAVMVNDFGAVQIDADLIAGATGDVVRLTNGCVCCSMDGDLYRAFDRVIALRDEIDHLVIEASGIAEPQRLTAIARAEPDLAFAGVVTVVCAQTCAARLADPRTAQVIDAQIAGANAVIVTRRDTAAPAQVKAALRIVAALNPGGAMAGGLDDALVASLIGCPPALPQTAVRPSHFKGFTACVAEPPGPIAAARLGDWFGAAPPALHRAKGFVRLTGGGTVLLQYAGGALDLTPRASAHGPAVVLIGVGTNGPAVKASFEALAAAAP